MRVPIKISLLKEPFLLKELRLLPLREMDVVDSQKSNQAHLIEINKEYETLPVVTHSSAVNQFQISSKIESAEDVAADVNFNLEAIKKEAEALGFQAGFESGCQETLQQLQSKMEALGQLNQLIAASLQDELSKVEDFALTVAFETICKLTGERSVNLNWVRGVVKEVIVSRNFNGLIEICVSPEDLQDIQSLNEQLGNAVELKLTADSGILPGGCYINTSLSVVDGKLELQLSQIMTTLLSARNVN